MKNVALLLILLAPYLSDQNARGPELELVAIERQLVKAWLDGDRQAIDHILDPDWHVIDVSGRRRTKSEVLNEMFSAGPRPIAAMTIDDLEVRMYGETGIVTGRTAARATAGPSVVLRFTDVFMKRDGTWRIITSQATPLEVIAPQRTAWQANPQVVRQSSEKQPKFNYDEGRVAPYLLPDPLKGTGGTVRTSAEWPKRRAEILELFREHVYGRSPGRPERLQFDVVEENPRAMEGAATLKRVAIISHQAGRTHRFELTLYLPNARRERVPVFLLLNNRATTDTDASRQQRSGFWPAEQIIARGYGIAAIQNGDLAPDDKARFREGVIRLFEGATSDPRPGNAWAALAAWGWGARRAMDYFETDARVDAGRVALVGHSRGGKAALWAGAEDERFPLVISNESGEGGAALTRRNFGETLSRITEAFPHWFAENYKAFAEREDTLPVDQHMLLSLIAPRALYVASADEDLWADPRGEFLAQVHASPVYTLFGEPAIRPEDMPRLNQPLILGRRAYHVRSGTHNLTPYDWERFADFADRLWPDARKSAGQP